MKGLPHDDQGRRPAARHDLHDHVGRRAPKPTKTAEVFGGKKVALFAVPGAYTPTCHKQHMAGFVPNYDELKTKGFETVACTSTNDIFVLTHWAKDSKADDKILMLADGSAEFAKKSASRSICRRAASGFGPSAIR